MKSYCLCWSMCWSLTACLDELKGEIAATHNLEYAW